MTLRHLIRRLPIACFISVLCMAQPPAPREIRILALGDSLTEGYGVPLADAYPSVLEKRLRERFEKESLSVTVVNAGVGGSTSASGPARLRWHLRASPDLVILALGANDMLRGLPPESTEKNLRATLELAATKKVPVILAGMKVPPNYGKAYRERFEALYPRLAREFRVPLIRFLLEGVAGNPELNQEDGIHPNEKGQRRIAEEVLPDVEKWIRSSNRRPSS